MTFLGLYVAMLVRSDTIETNRLWVDSISTDGIQSYAIDDNHTRLTPLPHIYHPMLFRCGGLGKFRQVF